MSVNKNNNGKKKIAPIIFTILIVLYLVGIIAVTLVGSRIDNVPVVMILIMVAPCIRTAGQIFKLHAAFGRAREGVLHMLAI